VFLAGTGTALVTGLGAVPVWLLGAHAAALRPALWGLAAGVMGVASIVGLLIPALDEGGGVAVAAGFAAGVAFLLAARWQLGKPDSHIVALRNTNVRTAALVFAVLFVHSLPEGLAIGTAYASKTAGLGLFVILAIAIQNIPEGTSVAIPMEAAGFGRGQQFGAAVLTSAPQPFGAVGAYLLVEDVKSLLPFSFAFAAGAMLALVVVELLPAALRSGRWLNTCAGFAVGALVMLLLSALLGVD
jgi:ZIP family zinc transporter